MGDSSADGRSGADWVDRLREVRDLSFEWDECWKVLAWQ